MKLPVKAVIICGPTATGKTALAVQVAKKVNGELISADSRQIYKGMDIGTGKDKQILDTKIWGYDIVNPTESFSVADYYRYVQTILPGILARKQIPIFVGGTGFYLESLVSPPATQGTPINSILREELNKASLAALQSKLKAINPTKWQSLNPSDQANPRRLIRAIEVSLVPVSKTLPALIEPLWIGLHLPVTQLDIKIKTRVKARATPAFTHEIEKLLNKFSPFRNQALTATGYQEWLEYVAGTISLDEAIKRWEMREKHYVRRQLTWFKKIPHLHWFEASDPNLVKNVVAQVKSWYDE